MNSDHELMILKRALRNASEKIAENAQLYDELKTADDWFNELLARAKMEVTATETAKSGFYLFA